MIKVVKPKIDINTKKIIKPAKVKINLHAEYSLEDVAKLIEQLKHSINVGNKLNRIHSQDSEI